MGLHLNYELTLPGQLSDADAWALVSALRACAMALPLEQVSEMVHLTETALAGQSPTSGFVYSDLKDVVFTWAGIAREEMYRRVLGITDPDSPAPVPATLPTRVHGFAVDPGRGSEPATFGLVQVADAEGSVSPWWWYGSCKTQYASVVSNEHLIRCHGSLVAVLDEARRLGFDVVVRDETGYWESRDVKQLESAVEQMNQLVARFAGVVVDAMRVAGQDSRQIQGEIFAHPDFERLEDE